jgi:hypothetical protein
MNRAPYLDYVSYNIQSLFHQKPGCPTECPMCKGNLTTTEIKPSQAMQECVPGPDFDYGSSLLLVCDDCRWWCVREHYEFIDGSAARRYGKDYLIYSLPQDPDHPTPEMSAEVAEKPWLLALNDADVYRKLLRLPEEVARLLPGGQLWGHY